MEEKGKTHPVLVSSFRLQSQLPASHGACPPSQQNKTKEQWRVSSATERWRIEMNELELGQLTDSYGAICITIEMDSY